MPVRLIKAADTPSLWQSMTSSFFDDIGTHVGPGGFSSHLWLRDRRQRDLLLEEAYRRGLKGWLGPPFTSWMDLPRAFDLRFRGLGLLTRRWLISRLAARIAAGHGLSGAHGHSVVRGHMLDRVFSDLLPEGIEPEVLREALEEVAADDFARRRNHWVVETYSDYLEELERLDRVDPRSIPFRLGQAVSKGGLQQALGGARRLHVYGILQDLQARRALARALVTQPEVEVLVYLLDEEGSQAWEDAHPGALEDHAGGSHQTPEVQPAPDSTIEAGWVAAKVKRLLLNGGVEPHEVAVVARSGREDTRTVYRALKEAGVPASVRVRTTLSHIGALKAFLGLFRAASESWRYSDLRSVVASPYFDCGVRVETVDHLARTNRPLGFATWKDLTRRLIQRAGADSKTLRGTGLFPGHLERDAEALASLDSELAWLSELRTEKAWVERTLQWLRVGPLHFRSRLSRPVENDWELVRFDQRSVLQLERLLREWLDLADEDETIDVREWYGLLEKLLSTSELALSTPLQKGVQVLEAQDAALTPFRHTYVVHANHGEFPKEGGRGGVFSDEERHQLAEAGIPLMHRTATLHRERGLWKAVTSGPDTTVLYRTTTFEGVPLLPSLTVPDHDIGTELPRTRLPSWDPVAPAQYFRRAALTLAGNAASSKVAVPVSDPDRLRHAVYAAYAETRRTGTGPVVPETNLESGPTPGMVAIYDPDVSGVPQRAFRARPDLVGESAGAVRSLPVQLLRGSRSSGWRRRDEAEEETTPLTFGSVAHDVLERFYRRTRLSNDFRRRWIRKPGPCFWKPSSTKWWTSARPTASGSESPCPLAQHQGRHGPSFLTDYLSWELEHLAAHGARQPLEVEYEFGFGDDPPATNRRSGTCWGADRRLLLRGRVDRIDQC